MKSAQSQGRTATSPEQATNHGGLDFIDLGLIPYQEAVRVQLERLEAVAEGRASEALFLLEHPPVVTLGRHGGREHLLVSPEALAREGVELVQSSRGGSITCHFPGQMVAYPICRVDSRARRDIGGLRGFTALLEEAGIATAARFGVQAGRWPGRPGVWIGERKLASIGVGLKRWIAYHGIALNVARDLSLFQRITLCGLADAAPTSLQIERDADAPSVAEVKQVFAEAFARLLGQTTAAKNASPKHTARITR